MNAGFSSKHASASARFLPTPPSPNDTVPMFVGPWNLTSGADIEANMSKMEAPRTTGRRFFASHSVLPMV